MKTLEHFHEFVKEINASNSKLHKQAVLTKYAEDEIVRRYLQIAFDPYRVYGISKKKLDKLVYGTSGYIPGTILELFLFLERHHTGTDRDIMVCQEMLSFAEATSKEDAKLLRQLICKDLSIGVDVKTISTQIPGLIPTFNIQLANKYFDKPDFVEGKKFAVTTKIDGGRIIALKEKGHITFYTRAGQKYEGLVDLDEELARLMPDNICLDGEITLLTRGDLSSKEAYKQTMKIVRTKAKEKHNIKMLVFDYMPAEDFLRQKCDMTYQQRRVWLESLFNSTSFKYFELLPSLYIGTDTSMITTLLNEQTSNGEEGIMINVCDAPYEFKRTNNLLKVKKFETCDLQVCDLEEGSGKYTGMLGAFVCEYKGGEVRVGSGLTDELRKEIWQNPEKYLNSIIEISFFEETKDSTGKPSLRFPTFKDFRPDKTEPNY